MTGWRPEPGKHSSVDSIPLQGRTIEKPTTELLGGRGVASNLLMTSERARYWAKVDRAGDLDCWDWQASTGAGGYGCFKRAGGVSITAHRYALIDSGKDPFPSALALHSCHRPICCNPGHLRWGTHAENMDDKRKHSAEIARRTL